MTVSELDDFLRNCFVEKLDYEPIEGSFMKLKNMAEITPVLLKTDSEIKAENRTTLRQSLLLGHWLDPQLYDKRRLILKYMQSDVGFSEFWQSSAVKKSILADEDRHAETERQRRLLIQQLYGAVPSHATASGSRPPPKAKNTP